MNERQQLAVAFVGLLALGAAVYAIDRRRALADASPLDFYDAVAYGDELVPGWGTSPDATPGQFGDAPRPAPWVPDAPGSDSVLTAVADTALDVVDGALMAVGYSLPGRWVTLAQRPQNKPYLDAAQRAEQVNGIPSNMLVRLLYQESRFNPAAYNAGSGATGIAQIVPKWHPTVDATDPIASIAYAGNYLAQMFKMFGAWDLALQAYNWGPGNLKKYLAGQISQLPRETSNYSAQILADVGAAQGVIV